MIDSRLAAALEADQTTVDTSDFAQGSGPRIATEKRAGRRKSPSDASRVWSGNLGDKPGNCRIVLNDVKMTCIQEQPDVIGWRGNGDSVLIECKASKADLRVDKHKPWRRDPTIGMGRLRWLFVSEELVKTGADVGYGHVAADWGIVYWSGKGKPRIVRRPGMRSRTDVNLDEERLLLVQTVIRATEGWGRHMFFEDGDAGPRFTTIMRKLREQNRKLGEKLRQRMVDVGVVPEHAAQLVAALVDDVAQDPAF